MIRIQTRSSLTRFVWTVTLTVICIAVSMRPTGDIARAADEPVQTLLELQPHCMSGNTDCPRYSVVDAQTVETGRFEKDGILDIDVLASSPTPQDITTVRSWIQYDTSALELRNVEVLPVLSSLMPGEQTADKTQGIVKIGGGISVKLTQARTPIARLTFRVIGTSSVIRFYGYKPDGSGETSVLKTDGTQMLMAEPSVLNVNVAGGSKVSTKSSSAAPSPQTTVAQQVVAPTSSAFPLLQIQNVRVSTKDDTILLGWDALPSSELAGYNVYYSTISGRYVQRRSITPDTHSLIVRDLEIGMQYFLAVRGFNAGNQETAFSQEVAVVVGRPETSTAPLSGSTVSGTAGRNPVQTRGGAVVSGSSGLSDGILWLCVASGIIGTIVALRRQMHLSSIQL